MSGVVGTWIDDWVAPDGAQAETKETIGPDGRWTSHSTYTLSNEVTTTENQGVVEIKDGCLILTVTNRSYPSGAPLPWTHRYVIVRANDHELVLRDEGGEGVKRRQK